MALHYVGGGFLTGVPRRDLSAADLASLPSSVRFSAERSPFYQACEEWEVIQPGAIPSVTPAPLRVLLVCPTLRLEERTVRAITHLQWTAPIDFYFTRDNPYSQDVQRGYYNIWHNMTKARQTFLNGNYDAMLVIESDILPPPETLIKLACVDADVSGGLYVMRHGTPVPNAFVYVPAQDDPGTFYSREELAASWGGVIRANGVCLGCALIRRHVLEQITFRMHAHCAPDWTFMTDCNHAGFVTACDTSVQCGHIRPDGVALWPDKERGWRET